MVYNEYINQIETGGIRTHEDALKYVSVRYSSFYRNYPCDSPIPASCLAQNGFYFDMDIPSIRCIECGFQTNDLYIEMMTQLLNQHYKHNKNCSQIKASLSRIFECLNDDALENLPTQPMLLESKASPQNMEPVAVAKSFATDEARLKSFEGVQLKTNVLKLAQNGLYHRTLRMDTSDQNDTDQSSANNVDDDRSLGLESLAKTLPSLIFLKCAYCKYECLLHPRSCLNTFLKNPIDEHREKFAGVCSLLVAEENKTKSSFQHKAVNIDLENDFDWLKTMYEFQGLDAEKIKSQVIRAVNTTEVVVESAPKIIFKLYNACRSSHTQASKIPVMGTTSQVDDNASGSVSGQGAEESVSPLNSRLDTNIIRKIVDYKFINNDKLITLDSFREAIQNKLCTHESYTTTGGYGDDFKSPVELAFSAYSIDKRKRDKLVYFEDLSDFIVFNLPTKIRQQQVRDYMMVKFGVFPLHVRILHEKEKNNPEHRSFCLVTLQKDDKKNPAIILKEIQKFFNSEIPENERSYMPIVVLRTEWSDIEKKLKPFIDKPIIVKMNTPQAVEEEHQNVRRKLTEEFQQMNQNFKSQSSEAEKPADTSHVIEENERLKNERLCVVCLSKDKNVLFLPCAHLAACLDCSLSLQSCPVCRSKIQSTVLTFT